MTATPPLLRLFVGNLEDAVTLGLIDNSANEATAFQAQIVAGWPTGSSVAAQHPHFQDAMHKAKVQLDSRHRPIASPRSKKRVIATVMSVGTFAKHFEEKIEPVKSKRLLEPLCHLSANSSVDTAKAGSACLEHTTSRGMNMTLGRLGTPLDAADLGLINRVTWVAPKGKGDARSAQYWRDRLGLIHIDSAPHAKMGEALVRVCFGVSLRSIPVGTTDWKKQIADHPTGAWLIRPTLVHGGNRRFVQRHEADATALKIPRFGKTRDLDSAAHGEGERESLLVCGGSAQLRFHSVELLAGLACDLPGRDNSDRTFVRNMRTTMSWRNVI